MNWTSVLWLILLVVFMVAEGATVTVTSVWFAAGALVALVVSLLGGQLWLQIVLFIAVSAVLLVSLRPVLKKYFNPKLTRTNVDVLIGSEGIVTQNIDNIYAQGKVKLGNMEWTARSVSGESISAGTLVRVEKIEGVKAFVLPVKVEAEVN